MKCIEVSQDTQMQYGFNYIVTGGNTINLKLCELNPRIIEIDNDIQIHCKNSRFILTANPGQHFIMGDQFITKIECMEDNNSLLLAYLGHGNYWVKVRVGEFDVTGLEL